MLVSSPIFIFILFLGSVSCSTKRSEYAPYKDKAGYREGQEDGLQKTSFKGNSKTKVNDAEVFASFRALELCQQKNKKLVHIFDVINNTKKEEVIRTSGGGYSPSYYYGMSPYYGRYSSFGLGIGMSSGSAWKESLTYPDIDILYDCVDKAWGPEVVFRDVSAENMKLLVKDLKGGIQVERIIEGSPNTAIEVGDIILKMDNVRIEKGREIQKAFNGEKPKTSITLDILREGIRKQVKLVSKEISDKVLECQNKMTEHACGYEEIKKKNGLCKK